MRIKRPKRNDLSCLKTRLDWSTYYAWKDMVKRCTNPKHPKYKHYGERGITVCERWIKFEYFFQDMGSKPFDELSLHRIDNNGNYEPGNCSWANIYEQNINRR